MVKKKNVSDFLGFGLLLVSIFTFIVALRETDLIVKYTGLIGSTILTISQIVFLSQKIR